MSDLFGHVEEAAPFKDIRNQRESVAEAKARLCQTLNDLLRRTPKPAAIANVQRVTAYKHAHKLALKVLRCKTSSRQELEGAISSMESFSPSPAKESEKV